MGRFAKGRSVVGVALVAVGLAASACGADVASVSSSSGTGPPSSDRGSTIAGSVPSPVATPARLCVADPSVFPVDLATAPIDPAHLPADQGIIMPDSQVVEAYVASHADEYSGVVNLHEPERLAVAFTDHLEVHRAALAKLVPHPDRLVVVHGCLTDQQLRAEQKEVADEASAQGVLRMASGDAIGGFVTVELRADAEPLAEQLVARYGASIAVTIGVKPYPVGATSPDGWMRARASAGDPCAAPTQQLHDDPQPGLHIVVTPATTTIQAGEDVAITIMLTNSGTTPITFEGGQPETGYVVVPGTHEVVGVVTGSSAGTGWGLTLAPGETAAGPKATAGTAACRPTDGFALPPGRYGLTVPVELGYLRPPSGAGITGTHVQWSTEVPITIVS